ncbi:hypothetical protein CALVIDRAFT_557821 [Calocera viscosa TUFC12733]|uniref:Uncharacterized protein n=1 Tax=Calocera viscosa (strain TUFC12733) TaxID=1330018 RepID=A0A167HUG2_CALVF|nr:hypothetical protein CALVIDRAFT_557821 [Calocera viscosa TUFC12733]
MESLPFSADQYSPSAQLSASATLRRRETVQGEEHILFSHEPMAEEAYPKRPGPALFSVYRIGSTAALLALGAPKALLTFQSLSASNNEQEVLNSQAEAFDVTSGVAFALVQMWLGYFEATHGAHWAWRILFDVDCLSALLSGLKQLSNARGLYRTHRKLINRWAVTALPPLLWSGITLLCIWTGWPQKDPGPSLLFGALVALLMLLSPWLPPRATKGWVELRAGSEAWEAALWLSPVLIAAAPALVPLFNPGLTAHIEAKHLVTYILLTSFSPVYGALGIQVLFGRISGTQVTDLNVVLYFSMHMLINGLWFGIMWEQLTTGTTTLLYMMGYLSLCTPIMVRGYRDTA